MIVNDEPYLIEYNVRMGDPECQTILPMLKTDLIDIILHTVKESLEKIEVKWAKTKSLCVVLCSDGYPDNYKKNEEINNFDKIFLDDSNYLFHAGTKEVNKKIFAVGGRVLNFISLSETFHEARKNVHNNLKKLNWTNGFYRKDIGHRVID